jgi:hypothetical protein
VFKSNQSSNYHRYSLAISQSVFGMKPSDFTRFLKHLGFAKTPRVGYNNPYFFSAIGVIWRTAIPSINPARKKSIQDSISASKRSNSGPLEPKSPG